MQRDELLDKRDRALKGEADLSDVMEVLAEFYLSFSKHIKETKDMISTVHNMLVQQEKQLVEFDERLKIIELTSVNPINVVSLHNEEEISDE